MRFQARTWTPLGGALLSLLLMGGAHLGFAADKKDDAAGSKSKTPTVAAKKKAVATVMKDKMGEMVALKTKVSAISKQLDEMAKEKQDDKQDTDTSSAQSVRDLMDQMKEVQTQLGKMQEDVQGILGWIEGQDENIPVMQTDISSLKKVNWTDFAQLMYRDTQDGDDGFSARRIRYTHTDQIDPRTSMKLSFDMASGSTRTAAEMKDAQLMWDIEPNPEGMGTQLNVGQQVFPLGYDLERSDTEREFLERSKYNGILFNGERGRGAYIKYGIGNSAHVQFGLWDPLSYADPQQVYSNTYKIGYNHLAATAGLRYYKTHFNVGISGLFGQRPAQAAKDVWGFDSKGNPTDTKIPALPKVDRQLVYLDGAYTGLLVPNLTVRSELMFGKDRIPTLNSSNVPSYLSQTNMLGWQAQAVYNLSYRNQLALRYEFFDPSRSARNDGTRGYELSYIYFINPGVRLIGSYQINREDGTEIRNNAATLWLQYKL